MHAPASHLAAPEEEVLGLLSPLLESPLEKGGRREGGKGMRVGMAGTR